METEKKRRGRPRKVDVAAQAQTTTSPEVIEEPKIMASETNKMADIVDKAIRTKKKELKRDLTRKELTDVCMTPKNMIDDHGVFMGEDYAKIISKPHSDEELERLSHMYQYDPVKEKHRVRIIFKDALLAVSPGQPDIKAQHITKLSMDAMSRDEEIMIAGAQAVIDKGREHFEVMNDRYVWSAHRWLAFIRDRANDLSAVSSSKTSLASNLKSNILKRISFTRKYYPVTLPKGAEISFLDRGMPGDGYKRETSIKSSEMAPIGTSTYFVVQIENGSVCGKEKDKRVSTWDVIRETLNCGSTRGTGGWRGSGCYGKFLWEELDENGVVIDGNTFSEVGYTTNEPEFKEAFLAYAENCICDAGTDTQEVEDFAL